MDLMAHHSTSPARLFVLLARSAPVGVILRRGPSDWVQMIQWHTKTDVFKQGQWFHGRIFEHRCDLSADGKFFAYCAYKPGNRLKNPDYGDSWTAVSKPPHFTAVALWTLRNTGGGGGYFLKDGRMWLNHLDDNRKLHPAYRLPKGLTVKTIETYEDESAYLFDDIHRSVMLRDGWNYISSPAHISSLAENAVLAVDTLAGKLSKTRDSISLICKVFLHRAPMFYPRRRRPDYARISKQDRDKIIRRLLDNPYRTRVSFRYQYALKIQVNELDLDGITWADFDRSKRLVLVKEGKLFAGDITNGELSLTELADFNYDKPPSPKRRSE
jgi:hypothetical protein